MNTSRLEERSRDCPECGSEMVCDTRIYGRVYQCDSEDCGNKEIYFEILDKELYMEVVDGAS